MEEMQIISKPEKVRFTVSSLKLQDPNLNGGKVNRMVRNAQIDYESVAAPKPQSEGRKRHSIFSLL